MLGENLSNDEAAFAYIKQGGFYSPQNSWIHPIKFTEYILCIQHPLKAQSWSTGEKMI